MAQDASSINNRTSIEARYAEIIAVLDEVDQLKDEIIDRLKWHPLSLARVLWNVNSPGNLLLEDSPDWVRKLLAEAAAPTHRTNRLFTIVTHPHSQGLLARELVSRLGLRADEIAHLRKLSELKGQRMTRYAPGSVPAVCIAAFGLFTKTLPKEVITALGLDYVNFNLVILALVILSGIFLAITSSSGARAYHQARLRHERCGILMGYIEITLERELKESDALPTLQAPTASMCRS